MGASSCFMWSVWLLYLNIIKKVGESQHNSKIFCIFAADLNETLMSYTEMAQLELMNAAANVTSQEDLDALRLTLSLFFAERAQKAIDKMWDEGTFDQKKLDELRGQHLRTPYK